MGLRIVAGVASLALFIAYFAPVVLKLREPPLSLVVLGGLILAVLDLVESLREADRPGPR